MNKKNKFKEWKERYYNEEFIDIKNNLTNKDLKLLKKSGIIVKDKIHIFLCQSFLKMSQNFLNISTNF